MSKLDLFKSENHYYNNDENLNYNSAKSHFGLHRTISILPKLSQRELQCLKLSIRGKSARQVGSILGLSRRTIEEYLNNVKKKFGVKSKSELIELAISVLLQSSAF